MQAHHPSFKQDPKAFEMIGYCPQYDALWDHLSVLEHFNLYAVVNGVKPEDQERQIKSIMDSLQLSEDQHEYATSLPLGIRRKISVGISLLV